MSPSNVFKLCVLLSLLFSAQPMFGDGSVHSVTIPPSTTEGELQIGVTHTLWIPPNVKTIRGIIVHQHGCGVGACLGGETAAYDLHWQELARKWDCALLGPAYQQAEEQDCRLWCDPRNGSGDVFIQALSALAKKSGHPEVAVVPWCLWGHSGGGFWASLLQMEYPERIVAIWFQSGTAHSRWVSGEIEAPKITAAAMQIPMMTNSGLKERDHERFKTAWFGSLAMFKDYRSRGAPIAFTPDPKSGHETRDSRYMAIPFFDACLEQRLPAKPGAGSPLGEMDEAVAWLADVPVDPLIQRAGPAPVAQYKGDKLTAAWLPNERVAKAWSKFTTTGDVDDKTAPAPPTNVEVVRLPQGTMLQWQASADFESGIGAFEIQRDGQVIGSVPRDPATRFGRPLFQAMSYHDTPESPLPKMQFVDEAGKSANDYRVTTINSAGLRSRPAGVSVQRGIVFSEVDGRALELDIHVPQGTKNPPLVVWIHGGGWRAGSKNRPPIRALTAHGYAVASISYRFTDKALFPAQIHDCKAAIRWLRAHAANYGCNADWIAVAGGSAGAHLALLLGVSGGIEKLEGTVGNDLAVSSRVQAVIDYYGPADFVLRGKTQPERAYTEKSGSFALLGGAQGRIDPGMEMFASPATYVSDDDPPLLVFHGDADKVVLPDQSERMVAAYQNAGLESELVVLKNSGHGGQQFFKGGHFEKALEFLNRYRPHPAQK